MKNEEERISKTMCARTKTYHNYIKRRVLAVLLLFIGIVIISAFLNAQTDDEIYYGFYEYNDYPENADFDGGVVTVDETMGMTKGDTIASTPAIHVDAGSYILDVDHQNDEDFEAIVYDGDKEIQRIVLPASEINTRATFVSNDNLYNMHVVYSYNGCGSVTLKRSVLYAEGLFYTDTILFAVMMILGACSVAYIIIRNVDKELNNKERAYWAILLLFVICVNYPYYRPFWHPGPDAAFHLARIEGIFNELRNGQFPVALFTDALHGRGSIATLYPQLFLYFPAMLRFLHVSLDGAIRAFFILINIMTCATSYYAAKRITGDRYISLAAMMIYCLLPYRLLAMTWRNAYGEAQAMVFMPIVVAGLYDILVRDKNRWPVIVLGVSGVLQSHVISTMNTIVLCVLCGILLIDVIIIQRRYLQILLAVGFTFLINLWYIVPFIIYLRSDVGISEQMMTQDFSQESYYVSQLLRLFPVHDSHFYTMGAGLAVLVACAVYIVFSRRRWGKVDRFNLALLMIGLLYVFMELKVFPWPALQKISGVEYLTKMVKFPARLSVISQPVLLYFAINTLSDYKYSLPRRKLLIIAAIILTVFQGCYIVDSFMKEIEPFTDQTEMRFEADVADQHSYDYVPTGYWEEEFGDVPESPDAIITDYRHNYTESSFEYTSETDTYVEMPLLYYLGYQATDNGNRLVIDKGDKAKLKIHLPASDSTTKVELKFRMPKEWYYLYFVSLVSIVIFTVIAMKTRRLSRNVV